MKQLLIIDAVAPFTVTAPRTIHNWSKIDFAAIEEGDRLPNATRQAIVKRFDAYISQLAELGYNAVSLDDLAHLVPHDFYPADLKRLLADYTALYKDIFAVCSKYNLRIFINTDYLFSNEAIAATGLSKIGFFKMTLEKCFAAFPEIDGINIRIGEHDGRDVQGTFLSSHGITTAAQANELLGQILPMFEAADKTCIFRTWTVGAHPIGDLIWNPDTYNAVFAGIESPRLIVSMKFGDTDFMRYLALNPFFRNTPQQKIIEFQTCREWEGMGTLPSFVGWQYADYLKELADTPSLIGAHVWCRTGGWAKQAWSSSPFLDDRSLWSELNTFTIAKLMLGQTVQQAVRAFCEARDIERPDDFLDLLTKTDEVIKTGLYIRPFAAQTLFLRRTRIPPLFWIAWDGLVANPMMSVLLRSFIVDTKGAVAEGEQAAATARELALVVQKLRLPEHAAASYAFMADTMTILAAVRKHLLLGLAPEELYKLRDSYQTYAKQYPQAYTIAPTFWQSPAKQPSWLMEHFLRLVFRTRAPYRPFDRFLLWTTPVQRYIARKYFKKANPELSDQSMGIDVAFT